MSDDKRLLLLNAEDNVLVCCQALSAGSEVVRAITAMPWRERYDF